MSTSTPENTGVRVRRFDTFVLLFSLSGLAALVRASTGIPLLEAATLVTAITALTLAFYRAGYALGLECS